MLHCTTAAAGYFRGHERFPAMQEYLVPSTLGWIDVAIRMGAATLLPLAIGLERFFHEKPIDFRPFVLISVGACGLLLASMELLHENTDPQGQMDPTRVIEGVITGIGFLGAGAMFRRGNFVKGAGSASAIWCAGAIGLICGAGDIWLAIIITVIILVLLVASRPYTANWDPEPSRDDDPDD
jgi:putative Mg2+ transporter-C (MgtC) family protein